MSGLFDTDTTTEILKYRLDPLSAFFTINALVTLLLVAIINKSTDINRVLIIYDAFVFPIGLGIIIITRPDLKVFSKLQSILKVETFGRDKQKVEVAILITAAGFLFVQVSQAIILRKINLDIFSAVSYQAAVYGNGGVLEEWLFRFAMFSWVDTRRFGYNKSKKIPPIISIILISVIFEIYHIGVYGGNPSALLAVFVSSIGITTVYWRVKRLWCPQAIHLINNSYIPPTQFISQVPPIMMSIARLVLTTVGVN